MICLSHHLDERTRTMRELRDYQLEAVTKIRAQWAIGNTRTAIVFATGLGKSSVAGKLATDEASHNGQVLILAHLSEALDQLTDACHGLDPSITVGRVQAERNEINHRIIAASVQTLAHDKRLATMPKPTMVIIDEVHHTTLTNSYNKIMRWAGCFEGTPTLGMTATLIRGDRQSFDGVFQSVADEKGIDWAVAHGWLVRPRGHAIIASNVKLFGVTIRHGDYAAGELGPMVARDVHGIVKCWQRLASDRITIAFTPTVTSALKLRDAFQAAGVPCEAVVGTTEREDRRLIYKRLAAGDIRVLVGVGVMTEAFDCPAVSCVLMAAPTLSPGRYQQRVGRGVRLFEGKTDCLVLDVVSPEPVRELVTLIDILPNARYDNTALRPRRHTTQTSTPLLTRVHRWIFQSVTA